MVRARTVRKLMRIDRALDRGTLPNCFLMKMKERRCMQKLRKGQDLCPHLLFTPAGAESMLPLSCSLATFLSEARGARLDNANELCGWDLAKGPPKGEQRGCRGGNRKGRCLTYFSAPCFPQATNYSLLPETQYQSA